MSITLVDEHSHHHDYTGNNYNLGSRSNFKEYKIESGKWILYKDTFYNKNNNNSNRVIIDFSGHSDSYKKLDFSPLSIRKIDDTKNSCIVFEHKNYCGHSQHYISSCPDVTTDFESGRPAGASSMIIWPENNWTLYKQKDYSGGFLNLGYGRYPDLSKQGFEDTLESLEKVQYTESHMGHERSLKVYISLCLH